MLSTIFSTFVLAYYSTHQPAALTIEYATTPAQIQWGLMQRRDLPENTGMLFHYFKARKANFWAFNCYIDLSVAFIDRRHVIREIKTLHAYPEMMDPARPVLSPNDFSKYPFDDPVVNFFNKHSVSSSFSASYILEVNKGWFEKNGVKVGDKFFWNDSKTSLIFKTSFSE